MSSRPEYFSFGYTYAGGSPPSSHEVVLVRPDRKAQYIAGHSWPKQPPFDEIGVYQRTLTNDEWAELNRLIGLAYQNRSQIREPRYADTGVESFSAWLDKELWRVSWNPNEVSGALADLLSAVRNLITDMRRYPLSTLQAALTVEDTELRLRLSNRGTLPFVFYGFGEGLSDRASELRLQICDQEALKVSRTRSPIQLLRQPPLVGHYLTEGAAGETHVGPGESLVVTVSRQDSILPRQSGVLYALLHLYWKIAGLEAEASVGEGWLMPQPLPILGE